MTQRIINVGGTTELFLPDLHLPNTDMKMVDVMIESLKKEKHTIDMLVFGGDMLDLESMSRFIAEPGGYTRLSEELADAHGMLQEIIHKLGDPPDKILLVGNHERRAQKSIADKLPALLGVSALEIEKMLELEDYGIEVLDNKRTMGEHLEAVQIGGLYHLHGDEGKGAYSVDTARKMLNEMCESIIFGHVHRTDSYYFRTIGNRLLQSHSVGCMTPLAPPWCSKNNWNFGFAVVKHLSDTEFEVHNYPIFNGRVKRS